MTFFLLESYVKSLTSKPISIGDVTDQPFAVRWKCDYITLESYIKSLTSKTCFCEYSLSLRPMLRLM